MSEAKSRDASEATEVAVIDAARALVEYVEKNKVEGDLTPSHHRHYSVMRGALSVWDRTNSATTVLTCRAACVGASGDINVCNLTSGHEGRHVTALGAHWADSEADHGDVRGSRAASGEDAPAVADVGGAERPSAGPHRAGSDDASGDAGGARVGGGDRVSGYARGVLAAIEVCNEVIEATHYGDSRPSQMTQGAQRARNAVADLLRTDRVAATCEPCGGSGMVATPSGPRECDAAHAAPTSAVCVRCGFAAGEMTDAGRNRPCPGRNGAWPHDFGSSIATAMCTCADASELHERECPWLHANAPYGRCARCRSAITLPPTFRGIGPDICGACYVAAERRPTSATVVTPDFSVAAALGGATDSKLVPPGVTVRWDHGDTCLCPACSAQTKAVADLRASEATFARYRRSQIAELRPWRLGEDDPARTVSISQVDRENGSPKPGDMVARNPKNHADQWFVAAAYFADNFEPLDVPRTDYAPILAIVERERLYWESYCEGGSRHDPERTKQDASDGWAACENIAAAIAKLGAGQKRSDGT